MRSQDHTSKNSSHLFPSFRFSIPKLRPRTKRSLNVLLNGIVIGTLLTAPLTNIVGASSPVSASAASNSSIKLPQSPQAPQITGTPDTSTETATAIATGIATGTVFATGTPTAIDTGTDTGTPTGTGTSIIGSTATTTITPEPITYTPPPTYTFILPTPPPTLPPITDTQYVDHAIEQERTALLAQVNALPALTNTITGTLVSGQTGGKITSQDGGLMLGIIPGVVPSYQNINVRVNRRTFSAGDPRATRNGYPLAYTYELTATENLAGEPVTHFQNEVTLVWNIDPAVLQAAGVRGFPLSVYTYNEQNGMWEEVLSRWDPNTNQLIATTPHFSLYTVSDGFDEINNYIPTVNDFETSLQSGTASVNYPINLPPGPGGFGPKVTLSYNSGNIDRVDNSQQGASSVGWGWTLSTSYIAASQHSFDNNYNPWTASIVMDGVNGDIVKGADGYWHTSNESYARLQYFPPDCGCSQADTWEVWGKDGTHYFFDLRTLIHDTYVNPAPLVTNRWMLDKAVDVHGNTITYTYGYERKVGGGPTATPPPLEFTPIADDQTRAVYPDKITYGATDGTGDKVQVTFHIADRRSAGIGAGTPTPTVIPDVSDNDRSGGGSHGHGIFQSYMADRIDVQRKQQTMPSPLPAGCGGDGYCLLRSYHLDQGYDIVLPSSSATPVSSSTPSTTPQYDYHHLTLRGISQYGNDSTSYLPSTTFKYYPDTQCPATGDALYDVGHLCLGSNGYGGSVGFVYTAAGGDSKQAYRRVSAKWVRDGLDNSTPTGTATQQPHNVQYVYDYRGAALNDASHSKDAVTPTPGHPLHFPGQESRGFAWVQERDPSGQVTEHYFGQDDDFKAQEWRVQTGKAITVTDDLSGTPTADNKWSVTSNVVADVDPSTETPTITPNTVWKLPISTSAPDTSIVRTNGVTDGADISMRFMMYSPPGDTAADADRFSGTYKIYDQNGDYFALVVHRTGNEGSYELQPKLVWCINAANPGCPGHIGWGERDLGRNSPVFPRYKTNTTGMFRNTWYTMKLHTSPDGRFALELYRDKAGHEEYLQVKSGDPADDTGGVIPSFPTGKTWTFQHWTGWHDDTNPTRYVSLVDDYSEARTIYTQSDTVYALTPIATWTRPPSNTNTPTPVPTRVEDVGNNNCDGMHITFVPAVESDSALFGMWAAPTATPPADPCCELGQSKTTRTTYRYDAFGNKIATFEYGDPGTSHDDRSTHSGYVVATATSTSVPGLVSQYIVDKPAWTNIYYGITENGGGGNWAAQAQYYYDNQPTPGVIPAPPTGKGDVTQAKQMGLVSGVYTGQDSAQQFHYDPFGNKDQVTDPNNNTSSTGFDPYYQSFPMTVTLPTGRNAYSYYDFKKDVVTQTIDLNGTSTRMDYDAFGRPYKNWIEPDDSADAPTESYYFPDVNQTSAPTPFYISINQRLQSGTATPTQVAWQTRWFDGRGRVLADVSPKDGTNSIVTHDTYNINGQLETKSLPYSVANNNPTASITPDTSKPKVTSYYDPLGRILQQMNPDGTSTYHDYNWMRNVGALDESGHWTSWTATDGRGRMISAKEVDPHVTPTISVSTNYSYDALDHLTRVYRAAGTFDETISSMTYDGLGRKSQMSDPDMGTWQYQYDAAGNLTVQKDALFLAGGHDDHQIFYSYDSMNRVTAKFYGQGHFEYNVPDVKYYYDNALGDAYTTNSWGKLRAAEVTLQGQGDKANGHEYEYDARGRTVKDVITTTNTYTTRPYTTTYSYDTAGRVRSVTYPNYQDPPGTPNPTYTPEQVTVSYNGQGIGLPNQLTSNMTGNVNPVDNATYNERGQLITLGQGTANTNNYLTTTYGYDDGTNGTKRGWLTDTLVTTSNGSGGSNTLLNLGMTYFANGNVQSVSNTGITGPNAITNPEFINSFEYDGFNRLTHASSTIISTQTPAAGLFPEERYTFDDLDRMTSRTIGSNATPNTYAYWTPTGTATPQPKDGPISYTGPGLNNTYQYDANGNQTSGTVNGVNQTRSFDPEGRVSEIISGTVGTSFVYDANGQRLVKNVYTAGGNTPTPTPTFCCHTATLTRTATRTPTITLTGTRTNTPINTPTPCVYHYFDPQPGAPENGGTVAVGEKFILDLKVVYSGQNTVSAQQAYLTFTNSLLQNVSVTQSGCVLSTSVTADTTTFDGPNQNEVCNNNTPCTINGRTVPAASIAYASGALSNPAATGDFRVARVAFCAMAVGTATLHWQFSPPAPITRDTEIITTDGNRVQIQECYQLDYTINITNSPVFTNTPTNTPTVTNTPTATRTPTNTPTATNTPLITNTPTVTRTPTNTYTRTNTPTCASIPTNTPTPSSCLTCPNAVHPPTGGDYLHETNSGTRSETTLHNYSSCDRPVGVASYMDTDGTLGNQELYDYVEYLLPAGQSVTLFVALPTCNYQTDTFCGVHLENFRCNQQYGNDNRLIDSMTPTPTPTRPPYQPLWLVGHVTWQSIPQNNARSVLPITLTLKLGAGTTTGKEVNYARQNTDASGFFTVPVSGLAIGSNHPYTWRVQGPDGATGGNTGPGFLAASGMVTLVGTDASQTNLEISTMKGGDANHDNLVSSLDFNILKTTFGLGAGQTGYDGRADFDNNLVVNASDFNILKTSFGLGGAPKVGPGSGPSHPDPNPDPDPKSKLDPTLTPTQTPSPASDVSKSRANGTNGDDNANTNTKANSRDDNNGSSSAGKAGGDGILGVHSIHSISFYMFPTPEHHDIKSGIKSHDVKSDAWASNSNLKAPQIPNRPNIVTSRTLYIGNLYEEDITDHSDTTPPYISYYYLGGKLVGMRRANYGSDNSYEQFRIVGDHLGSTTIIVDVPTGSATPAVVQRQYSKPYGETMQLTAGSSLTSIGYTGQRQDSESGLMFYGARYYDPVLSFFISADTIAPDPSDPKSRNRYSYVLNNPIVYNDPTGHNQQDYQKCHDDPEHNRDACAADFRDLNIELEHEEGYDWTSSELAAMLEAIHKLMDTAGWDYTDFKKALGSDQGRTTIFTKRHKADFEDRTFGGVGLGTVSAQEYYSGNCWVCSNKNVIAFYDGAFSSLSWLKKTTVHELAHAWDSASGDRLSRQMMEGAGGEEGMAFVGPEPGKWKHVYRPGNRGDPVSDYGRTNRFEDFAEAVTSVVYPEQEDFKRTYDPNSYRSQYVRDQFR